jgi:hypothetical protein
MDVQINILLEGLKKKEAALGEIVSITENQRTVIESGLELPEVRNFLMEMNKEKQPLIDTVKNCDNLFESVLKEVGPELDANQHLYKNQVMQMQKLIRAIMDLDVKVRLMEEENNKLLMALMPVFTQAGLAPKPKLLPPDNARVIKAYEQEKRFRG